MLRRESFVRGGKFSLGPGEFSSGEGGNHSLGGMGNTSSTLNGFFAFRRGDSGFKIASDVIFCKQTATK